jgi:hypothetical protein
LEAKACKKKRHDFRPGGEGIELTAYALRARIRRWRTILQAHGRRSSHCRQRCPERSYRGRSARPASPIRADRVEKERRHPLLAFLGKFWAPVAWMLEATIALEILVHKLGEAVITAVLLLFNSPAFIQGSVGTRGLRPSLIGYGL